MTSDSLLRRLPLRSARRADDAAPPEGIPLFAAVDGLARLDSWALPIRPGWRTGRLPVMAAG